MRASCAFEFSLTLGFLPLSNPEVDGGEIEEVQPPKDCKPCWRRERRSTKIGVAKPGQGRTGELFEVVTFDRSHGLAIGEARTSPVWPEPMLWLDPRSPAPSGTQVCDL
jgi:hypothetical protein